MDRGNFTAAVSNLEKVIKLAPPHPQLYKKLAQLQIYAGNYQKAAANAEKAAQLAPEDAQVQMMLANALWDRGWKNKAIPAYQKAYELGERDKAFLLSYAAAMEEMGDRREVAELEEELFREQQCKRYDELIGYHNLYYNILENRTLFAEDVEALLDHYDTWIRANREYDGEELISPLNHFISYRQGLLSDRKISTRVERSLREAQKVGAINEDQLFNLRCLLQQRAIEVDRRLTSKRWCKLAELMEYDPDEYGGFSKVRVYDQLLCLMKGESEALKKDLPIIKTSYPILYDTYGQILNEMVQYPVDAYKYLKPEFERLVRKLAMYDDCEFCALYPEELRVKTYASDPGGKEELVYDSFEDPYVREKDKVGRNDPCPCGSGKKFKKCCMGKGIYD